MSGRRRQETALSPSMKAQIDALERRYHKVSVQAAEVVEGLLEPELLENGEPNPKYNPDAKVTKAQCSMRTWASLQIVESDRKDARTRTMASASNKPMGVVILQNKLSASDWEAQAQRLSKLRAEPQPNKPVIDVEVKDGAK